MTLSRRGYRAAVVGVTCAVFLLVVGAGAVATETTTGTDAQAETDISVQNLSAPSEVRLGENYTVTAEIVNQGDEQEVRRVSYRIAGNVIEANPVLIPARDTQSVQFNVTEADTSGFAPGAYTHGVFVDDAQATANVTFTAADETPEEAETPTPEPSAATVSFENQTSNGTAVTVESVTVPESGFVVIHDESIIEGEVLDSMVGQSEFLEAGTHQNVTVELDEPLNESQRLVAVVYRDSNDNQEYDFVTSNRTTDGPYTKPDSREAVNEIAFVDVEDEEGE